MSEKEEIELPIRFDQTLNCPICGDLHVIRWQYKGVPLLACPKMDPDKIYFTGEPQSFNPAQDEAEHLAKIRKVVEGEE